VEDCQVPGDTALNELFEDNVSSGNSHLRAAIGSVVNFYCNAGTGDGLSTKLKTSQWVAGDVSRNGFLCRLGNLLHYFSVATGACAKRERKGNQD
jgi:hypothetical protein